MIFRKDYLDLFLVPSGMLLMFGYHFFILYRYLNLPHKTVFGFENIDKKYWVEKAVQMEGKDNASFDRAGVQRHRGNFLCVSLFDYIIPHRSLDRE
ncbi:hypothetical protein RHMOL_Rhmol02G0149100 [Rhododendron molle]|uniref:Uncharacterized protein n=1 Tax=Rhododendron molle TaxID=49168 RepID=A0ACC0PPX6_RHOML|nr:hypothetical protein RHMOL_Rhmol02G0149100 [Rhododendron molle]